MINISKNNNSGFTIVELLIVIVVIAILASITVVAFSGVQSRSRDSARNSDVNSIQKALELYRAQYNVYPARNTIGSNIPSGFEGRYGASYAYSVDTAGNWLKNLKDGGFAGSIPVDPINDNDHYYIYWSSGIDGYGACTEPFYMLAVVGYESSTNIPSNSRRLNCTGNGSSASWSPTPTMGVFSNTTTP